MMSAAPAMPTTLMVPMMVAPPIPPAGATTEPVGLGEGGGRDRRAGALPRHTPPPPAPPPERLCPGPRRRAPRPRGRQRHARHRTSGCRRRCRPAPTRSRVGIRRLTSAGRLGLLDQSGAARLLRPPDSREEAAASPREAPGSREGCRATPAVRSRPCPRLPVLAQGPTPRTGRPGRRPPRAPARARSRSWGGSSSSSSSSSCGPSPAEMTDSGAATRRAASSGRGCWERWRRGS